MSLRIQNIKSQIEQYFLDFLDILYILICTIKALRILYDQHFYVKYDY